MLYGRLPPKPDITATPYEKGTYAPFLMMLFRPHRSSQDVVNFAFTGHYFSGTEDDAWNAIHHEYQAWRSMVESTAAQCQGKAPALSAAWWSSLVSHGMRNYDLAAAKHKTIADSTPANLDALPVMITNVSTNTAEADGEPNHDAIDSDTSDEP